MSQVEFVNRIGKDSEKWNRYQGTDIIPAWVADIDCKPAPAILSALQKRLDYGVLGYSAIGNKVKDVVLDYFHRRWNWSIASDWLTFSPGLGAAIHNVCRTVAEKEQIVEIITPSPIYHVFRSAPDLAGTKRVDVPMRYDAINDVWYWSIEDIEAAITPRTRLLQLCNPHNPNGKVFSKTELWAIGELCCKHNLIICADEVHADLILDEDKNHTPIASLDDEIAQRVITLQSPSKAYNIAGLNCAVTVISNAHLRHRYQKASMGKVIGHLNPFGIIATQVAWGGQCDDWRHSLIMQLRANRDALKLKIDAEDNMQMPHLESTYLAWLNIQDCGLSNPSAHFESFNIGMSPGSTFGDPNYMRLNFGCSPHHLQDMIIALQKSLEAIH